MEKMPKSGNEVQAFNDAKSKSNARIIADLMFSGDDRKIQIANSLYAGQRQRNKVLDI